MTTLIVKSSKPRNPLVAAARFRRAGKHGAANPGDARRAGRKALKNEISALNLPRTERARPPSV